MDRNRKYLIFKVMLRSFATFCIVYAWLTKDIAQVQGAPAWNAISFWTGIVIAVISFFL